MWRNYILIAARSLQKHKLFSFINVFGLALSVSVCMIVLVRVVDAFDYDRFHPESSLIYRITTSVTNPQGETITFASSPLPLASAIAEAQPPAVVTHFYPAIHEVAKDRSREFAVNGAFIEPTFFSVFGFTSKYGSAGKSLGEPNKVFLSEATAAKFYGRANPVGNVLTLGELGEFEVAGVISTPPMKSHINYDVYVSMATVAVLESNGKLPARTEVWNAIETSYTYVKLRDKESKTVMTAMLEHYGAESGNVNIRGSAREGYALAFRLQSLSAITPSPSDIYNDIGRGPSWGSLLAEGGIALIILFAACFNYTNLSVARALTRGKEVGIRKLSGAKRSQIVTQYVTEAVLISLIALLFANCIFGLILEFKPFNDGYELVPSVSMDARLMSVFIAFAVFCGLIAGAAPAWILSSFQPARVLRGVGNERLIGNLSFRKVLTVFQFSLSLVTLIFLATFYLQFDFLGKADPGFNTENVALLPIGDHGEITAAGLNRIPGIQKTGFTSARFGNGNRELVSRFRADREEVDMEQYFCNNGWLEMMHLSFVAGNAFQSDSSDVILNERAIVALGFADPGQAVGSLVYLQDSTRAIVRGVVKDFYSAGVGNAIRPVVIKQDRSKYTFIAVETTAGIDATLPAATLPGAMEAEWKRQNPGHEFDLYWLDAEMKQRNDQTAQISLLGFLGFITITIASLGLLGLVVYTVETRRKEISIRKVIGATSRQVAQLLSGGFVKLLMLSGLIALPIGYLLSTVFLMNFVNRVTIGPIELGLCFAFLLGIGLTTIFSQTWKASTENPSENLRNE